MTGVGSMRPSRRRARTRKTCSSSARPLCDVGDVQALHDARSSEHSKEVSEDGNPGESAEKSKRAVPAARSKVEESRRVSGANAMKVSRFGGNCRSAPLPVVDAPPT